MPSHSVSWFGSLGLIPAGSLSANTDSVISQPWALSWCILCYGLEHLGLPPLQSNSFNSIFLRGNLSIWKDIMLWSVKGLEGIFFMIPKYYTSSDFLFSAVSKITGSVDGMEQYGGQSRLHVSADKLLVK